jgi:hypothetical protein
VQWGGLSQIDSLNVFMERGLFVYKHELCLAVLIGGRFNS